MQKPYNILILTITIIQFCVLGVNYIYGAMQSGYDQNDYSISQQEGAYSTCAFFGEFPMALPW